MRNTEYLYAKPSGAWLEVLNQYRKRYTNKNTTSAYRRVIKRDFYNFKSEFKEEYIDWCWGYVALGKFGM